MPGDKKPGDKMPSDSGGNPANRIGTSANCQGRTRSRRLPDAGIDPLRPWPARAFPNGFASMPGVTAREGGERTWGVGWTWRETLVRAGPYF